MTDYPYEIISTKLQLESGGNMTFVKMSLIEKQTVHINKEHFPCKSYTSAEFIECSKKQIWTMLMPKINCTIAGYESIVPQNFTYCDTLKSAQATFSNISNSNGEFLSNLTKYGCSLPCNQKSYTYNLKYFHKHSSIDFDNTTAAVTETSGVFALSFGSLLVEERKEAYVYDVENLITSIGGNLGLFLGFSCFSTFVALLKLVYKKFA